MVGVYFVLSVFIPYRCSASVSPFRSKIILLWSERASGRVYLERFWKSCRQYNIAASKGRVAKIMPFANCLRVHLSRGTTVSDAGKGTPEVIILDPAGRENTVPAKLRKEPNGAFVCDYTPAVQGVHSVNVFFAGQPVPRSPFAVGVANGNVFKRKRPTVSYNSGRRIISSKTKKKFFLGINQRTYFPVFPSSREMPKWRPCRGSSRMWTPSV